MKKILIAFENYQELLELTLLIRDIRARHPDWVFILFDSTPIYLLDHKLMEPYLGAYDLVYKGENCFQPSFKNLSVLKKMYITYINTLNILKIFKKHDVNMMITGVPLVFFRFASIFKKNVINIAYMRALIIGHSVEHSFSNRLNRKIRNIPFFKGLPIFDSWYCDLLVTVSEVNCKYYQGRGMRLENIKVSGSLLLDNIGSKVKCKQLGKLEVVFLTYPAAYHDNEIAHNEQVLVINKLIALQERYKFNLTIRVHPRDDISLYAPLVRKFNSIRIDTVSVEEFLKTCQGNKVVVSAFSTLNFEWGYLGGKGCFYTTENLYATYGNFYKTLQLNPYYDIEVMVQDIVSGKYSNLSKNIYKKHKEGNISYFRRIIEKKLLRGSVSC